VADEAYGLRLVEADGTHRPFGKFAEAGYSHDPPDFPGGANGVLLEDDGRHALVSDVYAGRIYRVDIETEATSVVYDHPFGINAIDQDSSGTLWFTQSTTNTPEQGLGGLWAGLNLPVPTGAVYRLPRQGDAYASGAEEVASGLFFANGIAIDRDESHLYVAELMMDRVLSYELDVSAGTVSGRRLYKSVLAPDNLAVDAEDNLWIASPGTNEVLVVDAACESLHTVFRAPSEANAAVVDEWVRRSRLGEPRLELITPDMWNPLPGALTGMFWSHDGATVYFTGLGPALLKYSMSGD
jgi:sugar lactone lactonase YvrE